MAHLSLTAIEMYYNKSNKSLFDGIRLPVGINKAQLVNTILDDAVNFETAYTDGEYLKFKIKNFFFTWERTFAKWYAALNTDYNPLENYDRHESYTNTGHQEGESTNGNTDTESVTAYDSQDLKTNAQNVSSGSATGATDTDTAGTSYIHGNIGVTTSQQMLQAELDVQRFNLYKQISDIFIKEFCILVY